MRILRNPDRLRAGALVILAVVAVVIMTYVTMTNSTSVFLPVGSLFAILAICIWPEIALHTTLILAFTALPFGVRTDFYVSGVGLSYFDPFLLIAAGIAVSKRGIVRGLRAPLAGLGLLLIVGLLGVLASRPDQLIVIREIRPLIEMGLFFIVGASIWGTPTARRAKRVLLVILWVSAIMTILASLSVVALVGRSELAGLGADRTDALRVLSVAVFPALAVLCGCLALWARGALTLREILPWLIPTLAITFIAFSRNNFLAIVIALVIGLLYPGGRGVWTGFGLRIVAVVGVVGLLSLTTGLFGDVPGMSWVALQGQAFSQRVLGGLSDTSLTTDPSVLYRDYENTNLLSAAARSPIVGHGFGFAYQPPSGASDGFAANLGTTFGHNIYLWVLAKSGLLGLVGLGTFVITPLVWAFKSSRSEVVFGVSTTVALLAVCFVSPMPIDIPSSMVLGAVLGVLAHSRFEPTWSRSFEKGHVSSDALIVR